MQRKRRTRQHVIADLSINFVERQALLAGFTIQRLLHDYRLDLMLNTYNEDGDVLAGQVFLQVKATDSPEYSADSTTIRCRIERRDLELWQAEAMPVVLVMYDARGDVAYWLHIQATSASRVDDILRQGTTTVTIRIPQANQLDQRAMHQIADILVSALTRADKGG